MEVNLKALELIYRNAETQEELDLALQYNEISKEKFFELAAERCWKPNPIAIRNIASSVSEIEISPADDEFIESSNKAAVRRLHSLLEYAVTRFQYEATTLSLPAVIDSLDILVKVREKLTKLELPLYGLSTTDPVTPGNPINIFLDTTPDPQDLESDVDES